TMTEEIYVTRGEIMAHADRAPLVSTRFRANLIWLGKKPFSPDRDYKLKIHTQALPVRIQKIEKVIDASAPDLSSHAAPHSSSPAGVGRGSIMDPPPGTAGDDKKGNAAANDKLRINRHDVADLVLETRQPIAFDPISEGEATGRFVIVD